MTRHNAPMFQPSRDSSTYGEPKTNPYPDIQSLTLKSDGHPLRRADTAGQAALESQAVGESQKLSIALVNGGVIIDHALRGRAKLGYNHKSLLHALTLLQGVVNLCRQPIASA